MQPLEISVDSYVEGVEDNIDYALSLGLQELQMAPCVNDGTLVICGSGPSLEDYLEEIRGLTSPICGVKGAYDYLRSHNITPNLFLSVEPRLRPVNNPSKQTAFLLASRVNRDLFDSLKDYCIYLWHSWSEDDPSGQLQGKMAIGGGTTSGLRAINVGYMMGFRKFKLYGFDCSLGEKGNKRVYDDKLDPSVKTIDVWCGDRCFTCNMAMAQQAKDFQMLYDIMGDITIEAKGGLIEAIIEERKKLGMRT